jgi:ADP-heptose:LPS heptosyltransferase
MEWRRPSRLPSNIDRALNVLRLRLARLVPEPPSSNCRSIPELSKAIGRPLRVAVVRVDGIGDWILSIPLVQSLEKSPHVAELSIVALESYRSLLQRSSAVTYIPFNVPTILAPPRPGGLLGKIRAVTRFTQKTAFNMGTTYVDRFDLAILPRWDSDVGFNARAWAAATGALIAGHDPRCLPNAASKERGEAALIQLLTRDADATKHEIEHLVALMANLGIDAEIRPGYGLTFFGVERSDAEADPYMIMHTSSNEPKREWPIRMWRELLSMFLSSQDGKVILVGAAADRRQHEEIIQGLGPRVESVAGNIALGDLPRFLASARSFVGNDSGPAHVASSLSLPVVTVSAYPRNGDPSHRNSPSRFRPWGTLAEVVQPEAPLPPCTSACVALKPHCITHVTPAQVFEAHKRVMARAHS